MSLLLFLIGASIPEGYEVARVQEGIASVYWPGDGLSGKTCADGKPFTKERCHIAHRSWPLGSRVRVCAKDTGRCALSFVGDRGPFGACDHKGISTHVQRRNGRLIYKYQCLGRWMVKIRHRDPGTWRGIADLSKCVARKLRTRGLHEVRLELLKKRRVNRIAQAPTTPQHNQKHITVQTHTAMSQLRTRRLSYPSRLWAWYAGLPAVVRRRSARR